ncbi:class I SAM-dependent methyltransferase [Laspinema sp. D1]|uniref:class I SAM-dependent methyltransferase n=1 Tax=Laspinema palackyanum TaxID=3231601 RepID=UPI00346EFB6D|nr:class I SAM-dependent methyltransferase [Laspinema sp. D2b]
MTSTFEQEINQKQRFQFGENWNRFLTVLNDERISEAEKSLKQMLEMKDLQGKTFLDIGSGSGLFSLAARRLGAKVHSLDYDPESVACTQELKKRYFPDDCSWNIEEASVLNPDYLQSLGKFDVVYSWGVLHHTGAMWNALGNVSGVVNEGGKLFISIYNDVGGSSRRWRLIKHTYNRLPNSLKFIVLWPSFIRLWAPTTIRDLLKGQPFYTWNTYYTSTRGMSPWWDVVDWVGGYPFEVAKPEEIFDFYRQRGYRLEKLNTCAGGHGCNEFVFTKI